ncbi:MAG TPA: four helix bundle protein [Flavobacteriales bacterium]|nr:four helix bundle protein [Flavobacteriales bacterium]
MAGFKDLIAYKKAFEMSRMVFVLSKRFPKEETYSLTDQIRRSSRSVTAQMAEGYRKRRYPLSFIAKMVDSDGENAETQVWLDHAVACEYVTGKDIVPIVALSEEVGRLLADMIEDPGKYGAIDRTKPRSFGMDRSGTNRS